MTLAFLWMVHKNNAGLCRTRLAFEVEELIEINISSYPPMGKRLTSYSTPAKHSKPSDATRSVVILKIPLGSTTSGSFVSGSKKDTKKKGTLSSQGMRR